MQCVEITEDDEAEIDVNVATEKSFKLKVNGVRITTFFVSPQELKELATGFLLCEGNVWSPDEIVSIQVRDDSIVCDIGMDTHRLKQWDMHGNRKDIRPISSTVCFERKAIFDAIEELKERGTSWRRTGGTHSSIVCSPTGEMIAFSEDVSRACSVDKVVGKAVLCGINPVDCMLATTGRLSATMVAKAARAGFPLIASKAAPLSEGIRLAEKVGMSLVAFARKPNLYVYAGEQRVVRSCISTQR